MTTYYPYGAKFGGLRFDLGVKYFSNKVKGQTKRSRQMDQGTGTGRDIKQIPSLISQGGTNWVSNMVIDKSRRQK